MVCISNCDKITPGMLMAAMRLNIPPCSSPAGRWRPARSAWRKKGDLKLDLVDADGLGRRRTEATTDVAAIERSACPTCGSCSGMFTANSMNCLTEALGLSLPGNGSLLATPPTARLFLEAGAWIVDWQALLRAGRRDVLPRRSPPLRRSRTP